MREWRRTRWVRLLAAFPVVGQLSASRLAALLRRARRLSSLGLEARVRLWVWLRASKRAGDRAVPPQSGGSRFRWLGAVLGFARRSAGAMLLARSPGGARGRALPNGNRVAGTEPPEGVRRVAVYASSRGNFFHSEMADVLAHGLETSGCFAVERCDESREPPERVDEHIVVAPHEFFSLGRGARFALPRYREFRRGSTLMMAEQPGTTHFAVCLPLAVEAKLVLDLNPESTRALHEIGIPAVFFPIGYVPDFEGFRRQPTLPAATAGVSLEAGRVRPDADAAFEQRPIDVLFTGVLTPRRQAFFAEHAAFFAAKRCFLLLPTSSVPLAKGVPSSVETRIATALSQRAKIVLNLHRSRRPYFEWHRVVIRGIWQKAVVVSEPCLLPAGFEPGVHVVMDELARIPERLAWLLESADGRERAETIREAAHRVLVERYSLRDWGRELAARYAARSPTAPRSVGAPGNLVSSVLGPR